MSTVIAGCSAIAFYLLTATRILRSSNANEPSFSLISPVGLMGFMAVICHGLTIYSDAITDVGLNLDVFTTASIVAWLISFLVLCGGKRPPIASLSLVVFPFSSLVVGVSLAFSAEHLVVEEVNVRLHIALSLLAYSLFSVAAIQATYIAIAEYKLKNHRPIMKLLPPLTVMEELLFQLTTIAFVLLTIGLVIGYAEVNNIMEQHLSHKIVFSIMAWLIFLLLLAGRYLRGWRGKKATYLVIGGFVCLAIGFLGSKFVLEIILERV